MNSVILVTKDGETTPYKFVSTVSGVEGIPERTIFYHFKKRGYYNKNGVRIEKKKVL